MSDIYRLNAVLLQMRRSIKDQCRGNENLSLVEGNIYKYNSDLGIFINELRIFEIYIIYIYTRSLILLNELEIFVNKLRIFVIKK